MEPNLPRSCDKVGKGEVRSMEDRQQEAPCGEHAEAPATSTVV